MKKNTTTIHVRLPQNLKKKVQEIAEANGLDISSCIRIFLTHMNVRGVIPLPSLTVNGFTEAEETEILQRMRESTMPIKNIDTFIKSHKP